MSKLHPYLHFNGTARQAMEFYQGIFGGKLDMNTYGEFHASEEMGNPNNIMHSALEADNGISFMGSDAPNGSEFPSTNAMKLSLSGDNEAELRGYWDKLSDGATIEVPLEKAPWGDTFGQLKDKFGVDWMVNIAGQPSQG